MILDPNNLAKIGNCFRNENC